MDAYEVCTNLSSTSTGLGRFLGRPGPRLAGTGAGLLYSRCMVRAGARLGSEEQKTVATFTSMELYETGSSSDPWLALHS